MHKLPSQERRAKTAKNRKRKVPASMTECDICEAYKSFMAISKGFWSYQMQTSSCSSHLKKSSASSLVLPKLGFKHLVI